jgi:hypothetical protein
MDRSDRTREQVVRSAAELRKLIDQIEGEAIEALERPTKEALAAFDARHSVIDSTLQILRRVVVRRLEREQTSTEPSTEMPVEPVPTTSRPTAKPPKG